MALQCDLDFVADRDADDSDRIERMKDLLIGAEQLSEVEAATIAALLERLVVAHGEDILLRQHAANEIGYYSDSPTEALRRVFLDDAEDRDLRLNLLASFPVEFKRETLDEH